MNQNKIYVGNLSFNTTQDDLETEFAKYGEIEEVRLISDRETGRSKGFAFITFKTTEAMEASFAKNGEEMDGRALRVNKAEDKKPRY
ncbi:MAG: cold-inducible RNA-binding protein [Candidatus Marinamargulisbacteria bacterium]|jgi:cold-inducible RNA-binding protein